MADLEMADLWGRELGIGTWEGRLPMNSVAGRTRVRRKGS